MSLWPDSIVLDGRAIPLAEVLADVTIHHGREEVTDDPTASTCQITMLGVDRAFTSTFQIGVDLAVTAKDDAGVSSPRFTGRITDAGLDDDVVTVIAAGKLSTLGSYVVGTSGVWPVEAWSARLTRAFTEAGLSSLLELQADPTFDPQLAARDSSTAGSTTLADYLAFLAPMVGAAVVDRPDGRILVQALGARSLANQYVIDPAVVQYAPQWQQVLPAGNVLTVRYTGDQSEHVIMRDDASVALYGERRRTIDTNFVNAADASTRATVALGRGAYSHWNMREAPILAGLPLTVGEPVELTRLPPAAPVDYWTPIVEGWTDEISGADWHMRVTLSDPLISGLLLPWSDVPAGELWTTIDQTVAWRDALTLEDLIA